MTARIESGTNWGISSNTSGQLVCENHSLGVSIHVEDKGDKLKIPAPFGVDPESAVGEEVLVSELKDEEGLEPQVSLNIGKNGWLEVFPGNENNFLKIINS